MKNDGMFSCNSWKQTNFEELTQDLTVIGESFDILGFTARHTFANEQR